MDKTATLKAPLVGKVTVLSGAVALTSYLLVAAGFNFHFEIFSEPSLIFNTEGINPGLLRWAMITDVFGYYLLLLPVLIFLQRPMNKTMAWGSIASLCGVGYIMLGALGASVLAVVWPMHLAGFSALGPQEQEISKHIFSSLTAAVVEGIWNLLNSFLSGFWLLITGLFLRSKHNGLGLLTLLLASSCMLDFLGNLFAIKALAEIGLNVYLVLTPVWAILTGIFLMRNKPFDD